MKHFCMFMLKIPRFLTTIRSLSKKEIKIQHQYIPKCKSLIRNLLKLTSNIAKEFDLKISEQDKTLSIMYITLFIIQKDK